MYIVNTKEKKFEIEFNHGSSVKGKINGLPFDLDIIKTGENSLHLIKDHQSYIIDVIEVDYKQKLFTFKILGNKYTVDVKDNIDTLLESLGMSNADANRVNEVKAPMPGLVIDVKVKVGDVVKENDKLLVLEAMKMENNIVAPTDGVVKSVTCSKGQAVDKNQILVTFE